MARGKIPSAAIAASILRPASLGSSTAPNGSASAAKRRADRIGKSSGGSDAGARSKMSAGEVADGPGTGGAAASTKPIAGVKFVVPASFTEGTNLAPDSGVSLEVLPRAANCTGDIYLKANVKAQPVQSGAVTFSVATSTETVGDESFEEAVFAIPGSSPCIAMRYFLHTTAMASTTLPYDRAGVLAAFENIRASLSVQ